MTRSGLEPHELELVLQTVRQLGKSLLTPERCLQWDQQQQLPGEVLRRLLGPEVGLPLLFLPTSCGGAGGGARDICRVSRELARLDLGVATTLLGVALGCEPLITAGTQQQQQRWLGRVARRGLVVAYGVTEAEAGSNVAALRTTAEPLERQGQLVGYRLHGAKQFITNASVADLYTILARTPQGPSFFVVERHTPGLSVGPAEHKHGIRCSDTAPLILDDVELAEDQLVGLRPGAGLRQANQVFHRTRLMVAAMALGAAEQAMARAVDYSQQRTQFGRPLQQLPGYAEKLLLPHLLRLEAVRCYIRELAARVDAGEQDLQIAGAVAKLVASEAANAAADAAIQAHGGYGYTRHYMVEKIRRDLRVTTIYEGTSEVLQNIIHVHSLRQLRRHGAALYADAAAALPSRVAGPLLGRCAQALAAWVEALRQPGQNPDLTRFAFADAVAGLEHALAFGRQAASGENEGQQAACRLYAANTAASLGYGMTRCLASSAGLSREELQRSLERANVNQLLRCGEDNPTTRAAARAQLLTEASP